MEAKSIRHGTVADKTSELQMEYKNKHDPISRDYTVTYMSRAV